MNYHNPSIWHITYFLCSKKNCFFYPENILNCFLQFFFKKGSNSFFTIKITNNICPWNNIFNFLNYKNFFRRIWSVCFSKNVFVLLYPDMITNFKFRIFIINFFTKVNIRIIFNINWLHFNCSVICIVVFFNYLLYS